jgi:hypothetical protein
LNDLAQNRSAEIDQMLAGIGGKLSSTLWTAEMRPATRGGKCAFLRPEDEALLTDRAG